MEVQCEFIEIREEHLPLVMEIYDYYIRNTEYTFHIGSISMEELKELVSIGHPLYKSFLICQVGEICGYGLLMQYKKRAAYDRTAEVSVYLKPEHTGKGLGTRALLHLESLARQAGIKVLIATISSANPLSTEIFNKHGYNRCGHLKKVGEKFGKILDVFIYQKIFDEQ